MHVTKGLVLDNSSASAQSKATDLEPAELLMLNRYRYLLSAVATDSIVFRLRLFSVTTITHEPLHLAR